MVKDIGELQAQFLKGVGPRRAALLRRLGINTVMDALYHLPFRYADRGYIKNISQLASGAVGRACGKVVSKKLIRMRKNRFSIFALQLSDETGILTGKWFNQPFMQERFKTGQTLILGGLVKKGSLGPEMHNPEYEFSGPEPLHTSRITPVYAVTGGLSARQLRSIIAGALNTCLDSLDDAMPEDILKRNGLHGLRESIMNCHHPAEDADIEMLNAFGSPYQRRVSFDELFMLAAGLARMRKDMEKEKGISFASEGKLVGRLLGKLPFSLTSAQRRVFEEIRADMEKPYPMNRLLQGDVGSGKTVIALMAMLLAVECGRQSALMAPTEILAEQHFINMHGLIEALGLRICLLTGSVKDKPSSDISAGKIDIAVGTHALIQKAVRFKNLGLIIIDEQHRFGVSQRAHLRQKASSNPDVLIMTATPIPRTLAMTAYGDLGYSLLDELPPRRSPVLTRLVRDAEKNMVYNTISSHLEDGGQVYVVYPVIEGAEGAGGDDLRHPDGLRGLPLKSALEGEEGLRKRFPSARVALIHGRMRAEEREAVMAAFKKGQTDILVSTTVIEVGVDVSNASLMVIVNAERFGLSQLHQLRGRVGRGMRRSECILLSYPPLSEDARKRLDVMVGTSDGFKVAEEDLRFRGPGEFFGTRQSGMPELRFADIIRDFSMLESARKEAFSLVDKDPALVGYPALRACLERFWKGKKELFKTG